MVLRHLERSHPSICVDLHWSAKISGPARICTDQWPSVPRFRLFEKMRRFSCGWGPKLSSSPTSKRVARRRLRS